jgi:hypothetical protein
MMEAHLGEASMAKDSAKYLQCLDEIETAMAVPGSKRKLSDADSSQLPASKAARVEGPVSESDDEDGSSVEANEGETDSSDEEDEEKSNEGSGEEEEQDARSNVDSTIDTEHWDTFSDDERYLPQRSSVT